MAKPLYPHVPIKKVVQFPHVKTAPITPPPRTAGTELKPGTRVRLKSGTEGWVYGTIVEYTELYPSPGFGGRSPLGGFIYTGPNYRVKMQTGKHTGETVTVPANYVERA